jgi:hypothetical protein
MEGATGESHEAGVSKDEAGALIKEIGRPGHTIPFIARPTRAYLTFEVKDAPKACGLRPSQILEFKGQIRFSAAAR